jgi:hypothetical protein
MKVLYVYGDDDYSALTFCDELHYDNDADLLRLWNEAKANGGETVLESDEEDNGYEIYCRAEEFGDVDEKFIEWIKTDIELLDYDESKGRDFFIVKE